MEQYVAQFGGDYDIDMHIYEIQVLEPVVEGDIKMYKHLLWSKGGYSTPYTVGLIAVSSIDAVLALVDAGFTPVKVLNPQRHD